MFIDGDCTQQAQGGTPKEALKIIQGRIRREIDEAFELRDTLTAIILTMEKDGVP